MSEFDGPQEGTAKAAMLDRVAAERPISPTDEACSDLAGRIEILDSVVSALLGRLTPYRANHPTPMAPGSADARSREQRGEHVERLYGYGQSLDTITESVRCVLHDLDL